MLTAGGIGALPIAVRGHNQSTLLANRPPLQLKQSCTLPSAYRNTLVQRSNNLRRCGWRLWATSARVAETQQEDAYQGHTEESSHVSDVIDGSGQGNAPTDPFAGEEELERLLAEGGQDLSVDRVCKVFPYPLDAFQRKALEKFLGGKSVVVCAPTGAGKTAIAEAAAAAVLARGQRVIYTTPLKALSNQKLFEMRKRFGHARCGLQTGDTSLNTEAQIVIMTTEILRNIMYRIAEQEPGSSTGARSSDSSSSSSEATFSEEDSAADASTASSSGSHREAQQARPNPAIGTWGPSTSSASQPQEAGSSFSTGRVLDEDDVEEETVVVEAGSGTPSGPPRPPIADRPLLSGEERLADVGLIVMDEVHYLGDPHRGSVWEEAIINCPRHIQLVCMSATVKNPDDLGAWIAKEHMDCVTIKTRFRPVPLHWRHAYTAPPPRGVQLVDLLSRDGRNLNPRLEQKAIMNEEARGMLERRQPRARGGDGYGSYRSSDPWDTGIVSMMEEDKGAIRKMMVKRVPGMEPLILRMRKAQLLPAIWFILSRKDCDLSAIRATSGSLVLTTDTEQAEIKAEVAALRADQPEAVREQLLPALVRGVASHHAGHLPGWKSLVERLFQKGLLKIVFATGTLAAGINMPARTTVISALGRMTDDGPKLLPHNELLQMAGRAGRRGYDTEGHCIVSQTRFEGPEEAWSIIRAGPEPLTSQFNVSYGLVLNLLSIYTLSQAREFCDRSFGNFLRQVGNARKSEEIQILEKRANELLAEYESTATDKAKQLNAAVETAKEELRVLRARMIADRMAAVESAIQSAGLPRKVVLNLSPRVDLDGTEVKRSALLPAVLVAPLDDKLSTAQIAASGRDGASGPFFCALGADNRLLRVSVVHVAGILEGSQGSLASPEDTGKVLSALEGIRAWGWAPIEEGMVTAQATAGTSSTAVVALQLQAKHAWNMINAPPEISRQVAEARKAVKDAQTALDAHRKGDQEGSDSEQARADRAAMDKLGKVRRLQKQANFLRAEMNVTGADTWRRFTAVVDILTAMSALEPGTLRVLPLGLTARNIQGQNELWLALVLSHPAVLHLTGPELAGLLGAILSAEVLRKTTGIWTAYSASPRVVEAVDALEGQRQLLSELQADAGLGAWNDALLLDLRLAGIVEAWAAGATWQQIMQDSALDDGDIARLLIRTVDLLKQISWQHALLPHLRDAAQEALRGMDRKPIAETLI